MEKKKLDIVRNIKCIQKVQCIIDEKLENQWRPFANQLHVSESTIRHLMHKDIRYKSYVVRSRQLISNDAWGNCVIQLKHLLNKVKYHKEPDVLLFFFCFLCGELCSRSKSDQKEGLIVVQHSHWSPHCYAHKLPLPVMVLENMSAEGHITPPQFFPKSLKINVTAYIKILYTFIKPWIKK